MKKVRRLRLLVLWTLLLSLFALPASAQELPLPPMGAPAPGDMGGLLELLFLPGSAGLEPPPADRDLSGISLAARAISATAAAEHLDVIGSARLRYQIDAQTEAGQLHMSGGAVASVSGFLRGPNRYITATYRLSGPGLFLRGAVTEFLWDGERLTKNPAGTWAYHGRPEAAPPRPALPAPLLESALAGHPLVAAVRDRGPQAFAGQELTLVELVLSGSRLSQLLADAEPGATAEVEDITLALLVDPETALIRHGTLRTSLAVSQPAVGMAASGSLQVEFTLTPNTNPVGFPAIDWSQVDYSGFLRDLLWKVRAVAGDQELPTTGRTVEIEGLYTTFTGQELDLDALAQQFPELADDLAAIPDSWALVAPAQAGPGAPLRYGRIVQVIETAP